MMARMAENCTFFEGKLVDFLYCTPRWEESTTALGASSVEIKADLETSYSRVFPLLCILIISVIMRFIEPITSTGLVLRGMIVDVTQEHARKQESGH